MAILMKTLNEFLKNHLNFLRVPMVLTYVTSAVFSVMTLVDYAFDLSSPVATISFHHGLFAGDTLSIGYSLYYIMLACSSVSVCSICMNKLDSIEAEKTSFSRIVVGN